LCISCIVFEIPILGYFGVLKVFGGIYLPPMQNMTSYSCLATQISYHGDEISCISRIIFEISILGYLGVLALFTAVQENRWLRVEFVSNAGREYTSGMYFVWVASDRFARTAYTRSDLCCSRQCRICRAELNHTARRVESHLTGHAPPTTAPRPPPSLTHISSAPWDQRKPTYSHITSTNPGL